MKIKLVKLAVKYIAMAGMITLFYIYVDQPTAAKSTVYMFGELVLLIGASDQIVSYIHKLI